MHKQVAELYNRYNYTLRPLVSEIEGRNEYFEEPLLINVASMFDFIALSEAYDDDCLEKASYHLNLCISQSYQYLIKNLDEKMNAFESRCNVSDRNILDGGKFIGKYTTLKKEAQECVRRGRKKKDIDALDDYATAYNLYSKIEKLIDRELPVQIMHNTRKNSRTSTIIGWGLSILISVTIGKLANTYWGAFIEWLMTWKNA